MANNHTDVYEAMIARWPSSVVARRQVGEFTGGLITPKSLANADCLGQGPAERLEICGRIGYPVDAFVEWLRSRTTRRAQGR